MFRFQVVVCVVGCGIAPALGQPASAQPIYRGGVDLVSVTAVVSDRSGRPVRELDRDDFQVFDDGELRPVVDFWTDESAALSVAL